MSKPTSGDIHEHAVGRWHVGTPDASNVLKALEDGMNRVVFLDDKQVARVKIASIEE